MNQHWGRHCPKEVLKKYAMVILKKEEIAQGISTS
jgi:hypothetical protein